MAAERCVLRDLIDIFRELRFEIATMRIRIEKNVGSRGFLLEKQDLSYLACHA